MATPAASLSFLSIISTFNSFGLEISKSIWYGSK